MSKQVGLTDEQKQKMAEEYVDSEKCPAEFSLELKEHRETYLAGLNARDEEVKVLREALEKAANVIEWYSDWRAKDDGEKATTLLAELRALEHTSKKEG